jgi:hypothetical protein
MGSRFPLTLTTVPLLGKRARELIPEDLLPPLLPEEKVEEVVIIEEEPIKDQADEAIDYVLTTSSFSWGNVSTCCFIEMRERYSPPGIFCLTDEYNRAITAQGTWDPDGATG